MPDRQIAIAALAASEGGSRDGSNGTDGGDRSAVGTGGLGFGRVVAFRGFGGRRAGEAVLADENGVVAGSLLGGLADVELRAAQGRLVELPVGDNDAVSAGLACGGVATVLVSPVETVPKAVWQAVSAGRPAALVTLPGGAVGGGAGSEAGAGAPGALAVTEDPATHLLTRHGTLGDAELDEAAEAAARTALRTGRETAELQTIGEATLVVEVFVPSTNLVVVGDAAPADAIAAQGELLGWTVTVTPGFGPSDAERVADLGPADAVVVLSHDPQVDAPALEAALRADPDCYVGALGSRHTQQRRREQLEADGIGSDMIGRIHGPVGLDLGARTPEETAVAIAAEILAHRSGRAATSLRATSGPING